MSSKPIEDVKVLQQFLTDQGLYKGPITGKYLTQTYLGVRQFQLLYNIVPTNGSFGPKTRAKANQIILEGKKTYSGSTTSTSKPTSNNTTTMNTNTSSGTSMQEKVTALYNQVLALQNALAKQKEENMIQNPTITPVTLTAVTTPAPLPTSGVIKPQVLEIVISKITSSSTVISWKTNISVKSFIEYGETSLYGVKLNSNGTVSHSVQLLGLNPASKYNYRISASDNLGNVYITGDQTFTTEPSGNIGTNFIAPAPQPTPTPIAPNRVLKWGAYAGNRTDDLASFESLVGREVQIRSVFSGFDDIFPSYFGPVVGAKGKTLLLFWESSFGYDAILNGSKDAAIRKYAQDAKTYGFPIILAPFHEMNGDWSAWAGTLNNNTPAKFISAWRHIYDLYKEAGATNVKFALVYNRTSVPDITGNQFEDYYPGDAYVDYVGVDGFNFGNPWVNFNAVFDVPLKKVAIYNKPIYIFSMGSVPGPLKAEWIKDGLGVQIYNYPVEGWVWFHQDGYDGNWLVNSDPASLAAFKSVIPN